MKRGDILVGRFEIDTLVGQGGMGRVYRANDHASGTVVAIKVLSGDVSKHAARFAREAKILADLSNVNIVRHLEQGATDEGHPFIVMEWLDGIDLSKRIARERLTLEQTLTIMTGTANALAAAHAKNIIHRDIKPSNIFLVDERFDLVKVLDFGIAKRMGDAALTATGSFVGTPAYTAPEQAQDNVPFDPRSDVFSLGCVFYECLTGQSAFVGGNWLSVFNKVLTTDPARLRQIRPDLPALVEDLVMQMMAKDPEDRPSNCAAVLDALELLKEDHKHATGMMKAMTNSERRRQVVLLVRGATSEVYADHDTLDSSTANLAHDFRRSIETWGGRLEVLSDELMIVSMHGTHIATDDAAKAAQYALWIREHISAEAIALTTWNGNSDAGNTTADAVKHATMLLSSLTESTRPCLIAIDETTAQLLDSRFDVRKSATGLSLYGERTSVFEARLLLGQTTPCLGRERELAILSHLRADSLDDHEARAALLIGAAGMGKSRIVHEFLLRTTVQNERVSIWFARADALRTVSTLGLLAQVLRSACGMRSDEPPANCRAKLSARVAYRVAIHDQQRVTEFLGEMLGLPFPEDSSVLLRTARRHAQTMTDEMRRAWLDFLRAESTDRPVLLVLEDLHWSDEPTIRLIGAAFEELSDMPWMVVATARPILRERFPKLWPAKHIEEITVHPLGKKACERLSRQLLGNGVSSQALERIVARADGNAFYLEELIRHTAERNTEELPSTIIAMVQSRLAFLDDKERHILRAAAIVGESICTRVIGALLGKSNDTPAVARKLGKLVEHEVLVKKSHNRYSDEPEYAFRHMLLREGMYATLTDRDRTIGHKLAGEWLETHGETDAALLAMHFERGGEGDRAARYYVRSAELALDGGDYGLAISLAERGVSQTQQDDTVASLRAIEAVASLWSGKLSQALSAANESLRLVRPASKHEGYALQAGLMSAMYMQGALDSFMKRLWQIRPEPDALGSLASAFMSMTGAFCFGGRRTEATQAMQKFEELTASVMEDDPMIAARVEVARGQVALCLERDFWGFFDHSRQAVEWHAMTGSRSELPLARVNMASGAAMLGQFDQAEKEFARVIENGSPLDALFARYSRSRMLFDQGRIDEAEALVDQCSREFGARGELMIRADCRVCYMKIQLAKGNIEAAEAEAVTLGDFAASPYVGQSVLVVLAQIRMAQGRPQEASEIAERAYAQSPACGMAYCVSYTTLLHLRAEAFYACDNMDAAREAIRLAHADLMRCAAKIPDMQVQKTFLENLPDHRRTVELANKWLGETFLSMPQAWETQPSK